MSTAYGSWRKEIAKNRPADKRKQASEVPGRASTSIAPPSNKWSDAYRQGGSPAAPAGAGGWFDDYANAPSAVFLTGQNSMGTQSGFDTKFWDIFVRDYSQAQMEGRGDEYFAQKRTGVALWDDPKGRFKFGDTFINGQDYGNVYDQLGREKANLLMATPTLGRETGRYKSPEELDQAIRSYRVKERQKAADAITMGNFQEKVKQRKEEISTAELMLAGAGMGAMTGGGTGFMVGAGAGAGIGALIGGGAGAWGAYANQDQLREQLATRQVQQEMTLDRLSDTGWGWANPLHGTTDWLLNMSSIGGSTLTNVYQGARELSVGSIGDAELLEDTTGSKAVGLATGFGDALLRSVNPLSRGVFQAEMMGMGAGAGIDMMLTGGHAFDQRAGVLRNVFQDRETGEFTAGSIARGSLYATSPLVDIVQGVQLGGMARSARRLAGVQKTPDGKLLKSMDAIGEKLSLLAPSEGLQAMTAAARARIALGPNATRAALKKRTQIELAKLATPRGTVVNALGEGFEEGYQAIAEQIGMGHELDMDAIMESFAAGAVMGAGMHLGTTINVGRANITNRARLTRLAQQNANELGYTDFDAKTADDDTLAMFASMNEVQLAEAKTMLGDNRVKALGATVPIGEAHAELKQASVEATVRRLVTANKSNQPALDTSGIVTQLDSRINARNIEGSTTTMLSDYMRSADGFSRMIAKADREFAALSANDQQAQKAAHDRQKLMWISAAKQIHKEYIPLLKAAEDARERYAQAYGTANEQAALADLKQAIKTANDVLKKDYVAHQYQVVNPRKRETMTRMLASSLLFHRAPKDQLDSITAFLGQINLEDTIANRGKGNGYQRRASVAVMKQKSGDYDGDLFKNSNLLRLDYSALHRMRTGAGRWSADGTLDKDGKPVVEPVIEISEVTETRATDVGDVYVSASALPDAHKVAESRLSNLKSTLKYYLRYQDESGKTVRFGGKQVDAFIESLKELPTGKDARVMDFFKSLADDRQMFQLAASQRWTDLMADMLVEIERALDDIVNEQKEEIKRIETGTHSTITNPAIPLPAAQELADVVVGTMPQTVRMQEAATPTLTRSAQLSSVADAYRDTTQSQYTELASPQMDGTLNAWNALEAAEAMARRVREAQSGEVQEASDALNSSDRIIQRVTSALLAAARTYPSQTGNVHADMMAIAMSPAGDTGLRVLDIEHRAAVHAELRDQPDPRDMNNDVVRSLWNVARMTTSEIFESIFNDGLSRYMSVTEAQSFVGRTNITVRSLARTMAANPQMAQAAYRIWKIRWSKKAGQYKRSKARTVEQASMVTTQQIVAEVVMDLANNIPAKIQKSSNSHDAKLKLHTEAMISTIQEALFGRSPQTRQEVEFALNRAPGELTRYLRGIMSEDALSRLMVPQNDGTFLFSTWVLDMFLPSGHNKKSAPTADDIVSMIWIAQLSDQLLTADPSTPLDKITDMRVRTLLELKVSAGENAPALLALTTKLAANESREEILAYMNEFLRPDNVPEFTLWRNDIRDYDLDATSFGWKTADTLVEQGEWLDRGIKSAQNTLRKVAAQNTQRESKAMNDFLIQISSDTNAYGQDEKYDDLWKLKAKIGPITSFGSQVNAAVEAVWGIPGNQAAKGADLTHTKAINDFLAASQSLGFGDTTERGLWQMLAGYLDAVGQNPSLLASEREIEFIDPATNQQVRWTRPTRKEFGRLYRADGFTDAGKVQVRAFLDSIILPSVIDVYGTDTSTVGVDTTFFEAMTNMSLVDRVMGTGNTKVGGNGLPVPDNTTVATLGSSVDNRTDKAFSRLLDALLIAQTTNDIHPVVDEAVMVSRTEAAMRDIVQIWTALAQLPEQVNMYGASYDPIDFIRDSLKHKNTNPDNTRADSAASDTYKSTLKRLVETSREAIDEHAAAKDALAAVQGQKWSNSMQAVKKQLRDNNEIVRSASETLFRKQAARRRIELAKGTQKSLWARAYSSAKSRGLIQADAYEQARALEVQAAENLALFTGGDILEMAEMLYGIDKDPNGDPAPTDNQKIALLTIAQKPAVQHRLDHQAHKALARMTAGDMTPKFAKVLSDAAISEFIENASPGGPFPGRTGLDVGHPVMKKLADPQFWYLTDMLLDPEVMKVLRDYRSTFNLGTIGSHRQAVETIENAIERLTGRQKFGQWSLDLARDTQLTTAWRLQSAYPVSESGLVVHHTAPIAQATEYDFTPMPLAPDPSVDPNLKVAYIDLERIKEMYLDLGLNGSFIRQATIVDVDGLGNETPLGDLDLIQDGLRAMRNGRVAQRDLYAFDSDKLENAIDRWQQKLSVTKTPLPPIPDGSVREVKIYYVHKNASTGNTDADYRNIFRRGMNTTASAIHTPNSIGSFFSDVMGPAQAGTKASFESAKKGTAAIRKLFTGGSEAETRIRKAADPEKGGDHMTWYLDQLTNWFLAQEIGGQRSSLQWYRGIRDFLSTHIAIRYVDDSNNPRLISAGLAEQALPAGSNHDLILLPPETVRTLLGTPAPFGSNIPALDEVYDYSNLPKFDGVFDIPENFGGFMAFDESTNSWPEAKDLLSVISQDGVKTMEFPINFKLPSRISHGKRSELPKARMHHSYTEAQAEEAFQEHSKRRQEVEKAESNNKPNPYTAASLAIDSSLLASAQEQLALEDRIRADTILLRSSALGMRSQAAAAYTSDEYRPKNSTKFFASLGSEVGIPSTERFHITSPSQLNSQPPGYRAVAGDVVEVLLRTFNDLVKPKEDRLEDMLKALTSRGVEIRLNTVQAGRTRRAAENILRSLGYQQVVPTVWLPSSYMDRQSANTRAALSRWMKQGPRDGTGLTVGFLSDFFGLTENAAQWLVDPSEHITRALNYSIKVGGQVQTFHYAREGEAARAIFALQSEWAAMTDTELDNLAWEFTEQANKVYKPKKQWVRNGKEHKDLLSSMKAWLSQGSLLPTTHNTGAMIPMVDTETGKILFLRPGMKAPTKLQLQSMMQDTSSDVMLFSPERDETITSRELNNVSYHVRMDGNMYAYGTIPVSESGKVTWEGTGHKLTMSRAADGTQVANVFNGLPTAFISSVEAARAKGGLEGALNVAGNMIKYLGYDQATFVAMLANDLGLVSQVTPDQLQQARSALTELAEHAQTLPPYTEDQAAALIRDMSWFGSSDAYLELFGFSNLMPSISADLELLLRSIEIYLRVPGTDLADIMHSNPLSASEVRSGRAGLWEMRSLWTQVFDNLPATSSLRSKFANYMQLAVAQDNPNLNAVISPANFQWYADATVIDHTGTARNVRIPGIFIVGSVTSTGDDSFGTLIEAADARRTQGVSIQGQSYAGMYGDAEVADIKKLSGFERRQAIQRGLEAAGLSSDPVTVLLQGIQDLHKMEGLQPLRVRTRSELDTHKMSEELAHAFRSPLNLKKLQDDPNYDTIIRLKKELAAALGLEGKETRVIDHMVRVARWAPGPIFSAGQTAQDENAGVIAGHKIVATLMSLQRNVAAGNLPMAGEIAPALYEDLVVLYGAAQRMANHPLRWLDTGEKVTEFKDWVELSIHYPFAEGQKRNKALIPAVDSILHSYMNYPGLEHMLSSVNEQRGELLAGVTMEMFRTSLDKDRRELMLWQPIDGTSLSVGDVMHASWDGASWVSEMPSQTLIDSVLHDLYSWQRKKGMPQAITTTTKANRDRGRDAIIKSRNSRDAYSVMRTIRVGLALLHPGMLISSPAEYAQIRTMRDVGSFVYGNHLGALSELKAIVQNKTDNVAGTELNIEDYKAARRVAEKLGSDMGGEHRKFFVDAVAHDTPVSPIGMLQKAGDWMAKKGSRWQDPLLNRPYTDYALSYLQGLYNNLAKDFGSNLTMARIAQLWSEDANYFHGNPKYAEASRMALSQMKSTNRINQTVGNSLFRYLMNKMEYSNRLWIRWPVRATVGLATPFSTYAFSRFEQMIGGEFLGQLVALNLHARKYSALSRNFDAAFSWATKTEARQPTEETWDMSDVLQSLDLSEAFIRSGTTWTTYFLLATLLSNLGLDGTDPEERRRRRQGKAAGNAHLYDPRDVANDFRNLNTIYLDSIPWLSDLYRMSVTSGDGKQRSPVELNWIMRSILSPLLGITRFHETGNAYDILWGFSDALTSLPLINTMMLWDMSDVTTTLIDSHVRQEDGLEAIDATTMVLVRVVMNLERMLLESSFVNELYRASDRYDRDPYKIAERDENGKIIKDRMGGVRGTTAREVFIDPVTGESRESYITRDSPWFGYAESRASFALLMMPLTGGESWRTNMVTKTRKVEKGTSIEDARRVVMDLFNEDYVNYDEAAAVTWGAWKGSVRLDSPALDGFYMSYDTRLQLTDELQKYLVEDGLSMGLSKEQAKARANTLWWGDKQRPDSFVPLSEIVWSDQISYQPMAEYRQLNTTYVMGPDGRPWATGISRDLASVAASATGLLPVLGFNSGTFGGMNTDSRLDSVDMISEINTGMRALERVHDSWSYSEPLEQEGAGVRGYYPFSNYRQFGRGYGRGGGYRRRGGYGGRGGGGYAPKATFSWLDRWYAPTAHLPKEIRTFAAKTPNVFSRANINSGNPTIRRLSRRRERVQSQRGRLKPWQ